MQIISADRIFTGSGWLTGHSLLFKEGSVQSIQVNSTPDPSANGRHFNECIIVPAFIDAQVYGAAERLFAAYPSAETLRMMQEAFLKAGTCLFVPTLATNTMAVFRKAIDALRIYWNNGGKGIYGLHLEGPWLNEVKRGAHVKEWIHAPSVEEVMELLTYGRDVIKLITIAPEVCSDEVIDLLLSYNIILSAGHSNATYEQANQGFIKGITTATHLYNAMSPLQHRQPGLVGAVLNHPTVTCSIIPDGYHVDYAALAIAKKIMGDRLFAITDAVTGTDTGPYQHQLAGDKYECNGVLSGSALSMHKAFKNLREGAGIELEEALRMCSLYPAQMLRCDDRYGKIGPQSAAEFLVLDKQLEIVEVISG